MDNASSRIEALNRIENDHYEEVSKRIDDLEKRVADVLNLGNDMDDKMKALRKLMKNMGSTIDTVKKLDSDFFDLNQSIEKHDKSIKSSQEAIELLNSRFDSLESNADIEHQKIYAEISQLKEETEKNLQDVESKINAKIEEIQNNLGTVDQRIATAKSEIQEYAKDTAVKALKKSTKYTDDVAAPINQTIEHIKSVLNQNHETLQGLRTDIDKNRQDIDKNATDIKAIDDKLNNKVIKLLGQHNELLDTHSQYIRGFEKADEDLENMIIENMKTLTEKIEALEKSLSENEQKDITDINSQIAKINEDINSIKADKAKTDSEFADYKTEIERNLAAKDKSINKINTKLEQIKLLSDKVDQFQESITNMDGQIAHIDHKVDSIDQKVATRIDDFNKQFEQFKVNLQAQFKSLSDDIAQAKSTHDAFVQETKTEFSNVRNELETRRQALEKLVADVQMALTNSQNQMNNDLIEKINLVQQKFDEFKDGEFSKASKRIKSIYKEFIEFQAAYEADKSKIDSQFAENMNKVNDAMKSLEDKLESDIKISATTIQGVIDKEVQSMKDSMEAQKDEITKAYTAEDSAILELTNKTKSGLEQMQTKFEQFITRQREKFQGVQTMFNEVNNSIEQTQKNNQDLVLVVENNKKESEKQINNSLNNQQKIHDDLVQMIKDLEIKEDNSIKDVINDQKEILKQIAALKSNLSATNDEIKSTKTNLEEKITELNQKLEKSQKNLLNVIETKRQELDERLTHLESIFNSMMGDSQIDIPKLVNLIQEISSIQKDDRTKFDSAVSSLRSEIIAKIDENSKAYLVNNSQLRVDFNKLTEENSNQILTVRQDLSKALEEKISSQQKQITNISGNLSNLIGNETKTLPEIINRIDEVEKKAKSRIDSLKTKAAEGINNVQKNLTDFIDKTGQQENAIMAKQESDKIELTDQISKVRDLSNDIRKEMNANDNEIRQSFSDFRGKSKQNIPQIVDAIEKLNLNISNVDKKADTVEADLTKKITKYCQDLQSEIDSIRNGSDTNLMQLSKDIESTKFKLSEQQELFNTTVSENRESISHIDKKFGKLVKNYDSKFDEIDDKISQSEKNNESKLQEMTVFIESKNTSTMRYVDDSINKMSDDVKNQVQAVQNANNKTSIYLNDQFTLINQHLIKCDSDNISTKEEVDAIREQLPNDYKEMKDYIKKRVAAASNVFNESLNDKYNQLMTTDDNIKNNAEKSLKEVNETLEKRIDSIDVFLKSIAGENGITLSSLSQMVESLNKKIDKVANNASAETKDYFSKVSQKVDIENDRAKQKETELDNHIKSCEDKTSQMNTEIHDLISKTETSLIDTINANKKQQMKDNQDLINFVNENNQKIKDTFSQQKAKINELASISQSEDDKIRTEFTQKLNDLSILVNSVDANAKSNISNTEESLKSSIDQINNNLTTKIDKSVEDERKRSDKIINSLNNLRDSSSNQIKDLENDISQLNSKLDSVKDSQNNQHSEIKESLSNQFSLLEGRVSTNEKNIEQIIANHKQTTRDIKSAVNQLQKDITSDIQEQGLNMNSKIDNIQQKLSDQDNLLQKNIDDAVSYLENSFKESNDNISKKNDDINQRISDLSNSQNQQKKYLSKFNDTINEKIDSISSDIENKFKPSINDIRKIADNTAKMQQDSDLKNENILKELSEKVLKAQASATEAMNKSKGDNDSLKEIITSNTEKSDLRFSSIEKVLSDLRDFSAKFDKQIESHTDDIRSLQSIHRYNKEIESLRIKFDETVSFIDNFRDTITTLVRDNVTDIYNNYGDKSVSNAVKRSQNSSSETDISESRQNMKSASIEAIDHEDIGIKIRDLLKTNTTVSVHISSGVSAHWNTKVKLCPFQILRISGDGKKSCIIMSGRSRVSGHFDPSRCVVDGLGTLDVSNVYIEANIGGEIKEDIPGSSSLFVAASVSSSGPASISVTQCNVFTDRPLVNSSVSSIVNVILRGTKIGNMTPDMFDLHPITVDSGGFYDGWAVVCVDEAKLCGNGIKWCESSRILMKYVSDVQQK